MKKINLLPLLKKHLSAVHLIDWILILFMIILMIQTSYNLFFNELHGNSHPLDSVIRTTLAGLFGYFMGKGFIQNVSKSKVKNQTLPPVDSKSTDESKKEIEKKPINLNKEEIDRLEMRNNIQIIVIGSLGLISLILLIITRNMNIMTVEKIATLTQLRDMISGSTGFLISNRTQK